MLDTRNWAPVVVFAYRRPDHLRNTLTSLMRCDGFELSPIIVYCDGARDANETDSVMATRELARSMLANRAEYHFNDENQGLSRSVISGVSYVIDGFGRAIVLEDDLELSPSFLTFMNLALDRSDKKGYPTPVGKWLASEQGREIERLLLDPHSLLHQWCDPAKIQRLIEQNRRRVLAAEHHLYKLVSTQLWLSECIEGGRAQ